MEHSQKTGISFGITSATITTLGLMVGLDSSTHSKMVVIGGVLTIAIADAFSDALGIHISEESENVHTSAQIWQATISTFLAKFIFAMIFLVAILLLSLPVAIIVNIIYGLTLLGLFSFYIAKDQGAKCCGVIAEHLLIAVIVIVTTHYVGHLIGKLFN
ncbi:MAG: hypothetical protein PHG51_04430 [Candidatus Omnitrophica bacterium]|nr:hypothetical protein [Candidatus Omnitrophota bacterium]